jgi:predicted KAP-like P-loop ATPase
MSIDSPWGTGKTTFIKMWQAHLESQGVTSICFNAWESDYAEDPLVALYLWFLSALK